MKKKPAQKNTNTIRNNRGYWIVPLITSFFIIVPLLWFYLDKPSTPKTNTQVTVSPSATTKNIPLPSPDLRSNYSVEAAIKNRRTKRDFLDKELTLKQISQMLWSAQGVTTDWGGRSTPSSKATYPLSVFLIADRVSNLEPGEYQYIPGDRTPVHELRPIKQLRLQEPLFESLQESSLRNAPATLIITGNMNKMADAYGGIPHDKEVYLEAGHAAQNLYLEAESLRLGMAVITGFEENKIKDIISIPVSETIIYIVPLGVPKP